jgi:hypothetical protein
VSVQQRSNGRYLRRRHFISLKYCRELIRRIHEPRRAILA